MAVSVSVSVQMNQRALERDHQQRLEQQQQGLRVACEVIGRMRDAYAQQDNLTQAGRDVARAWADMAKLYRCA